MAKRPSMTTQVIELFQPRGTRRSVQELRRARDVLRFGGVFALTILAPALLLAYLSLQSIRSEELFIDAEYRSRATGLVGELSHGASDVFVRFREALGTRLERGESPLDRLGDLSPYLRGAYRFDANGRLAAPFELTEEPPIPDPPARYLELRRAALAAERASDWAAASVRHAEAASVALHPVHAAESRLGQARAEAKAGNDRVAGELLAAVYADFANVRESHGFRIGDLANLRRAELRFDTGAESAARNGLTDLVDQLLSDRWTVGYLGEATVVESALDRLAGVADPDWIASRRTHLNERVAQLMWAQSIRSELETVDAGRPTQSQFALLGARLNSPSVWATVATENGMYAFSFSLEAITADLVTSVSRMNDREELLAARMVLDGQAFPDDALTVAPLPSPLSILWIAVSPAEPEAFVRLARRRQNTQIIVVLASVFLVGTGVFFSARTIGQEIENARMKADFAANVSHELRSPITQIRLKGEALQLGLVDEGQDTKDHYDAIVRESERLSRLVDNVLDFAAIERGAKTYHLRMEDLPSIVWTAVEANREAVESRGVKLELILPDELPAVFVDREAIGQVVVNLVSNAAKYGAQGGWVGVEVRRGLRGAELSVSDRGIGISDGDLAHIFDHFYRSSDKEVRRQKGTGIGLTIVRYIVEAHGGTIAVDSAPNRGATFTVTFPFEPPPGVGVAT